MSHKKALFIMWVYISGTVLGMIFIPATVLKLPAPDWVRVTAAFLSFLLFNGAIVRLSFTEWFNQLLR